jgi:hypothetical protein
LVLAASKKMVPSVPVISDVGLPAPCDAMYIAGTALKSISKLYITTLPKVRIPLSVTVTTYSTGKHATPLHRRICGLQLLESIKLYAVNCRNHYECRNNILNLTAKHGYYILLDFNYFALISTCP